MIVVLSFSPIVLSQYFLKPFHYPRLNLRIVKQCRSRGASQVQFHSAIAEVQIVLLKRFNPTAGLLFLLLPPFLLPSLGMLSSSPLSRPSMPSLRSLKNRHFPCLHP